MTSSAEWDPEHHKVIVDLCFEQKMLGNHPGLKHTLEHIQERTGARFTIDQLMNHWDTMIKQWKIWCKLVQCNDMKWDAQTKTFGASDQEWASYLQVNPEAEQYRRNPPLMFFKKLEVIFTGLNLDGEGTSSGSGKKHHDEGNVTGDETTLSASNIATPQAKWSSFSHETFVNVCYEESVKGRNKPIRRNSYYTKKTWKLLLEEINRLTGVRYTQVQLNNHWEVTRRTWKHWCQTIGSPIMKWDAKTCKFGATDEDWENYIKENRNAAPFKRNHIRHADKLATIFKGHIEPGKANSRRYRRKVIKHHPNSPQIHEPAPLSAVYRNEPVTVGSDSDDQPTPLIRLDSSEDDESVPRGCHLFDTKLMYKIQVEASSKKEYSIMECMKCLDAMEEVEQGCDLYMFALDLFMRTEHREIFLLLKTSSLRMSWLLRRRYGA